MVKYTPNLRHLNLESCRYINASESICQLTQLVNLNLLSCSITNAEALKCLTNLTALTLPQTQQKCSFVFKLTNLTSLKFSFATHLKLNSLTRLSKLKHLGLSTPQDNGFTMLANLAQLKSLEIQIEDETLLNAVTKLTHLSALTVTIGRMQSSLLCPWIGSCTNLRHLKIHHLGRGYGGVSLTYLHTLTSLKSLHLPIVPSDDNAKILSTFTKLTKLSLYLGYGQFQLHKLVNLKTLILYDSNYGIISLFNNLPLTTLVLCRVSNLRQIFLSTFTKLTHLRIEDGPCSGRNFSDIGKLTNLEKLYLIRCHCDDSNAISALSSLTKLQHLIVNWPFTTPLSGLATIATLTDLQVLDITRLRSREKLKNSPMNYFGNQHLQQYGIFNLPQLNLLCYADHETIYNF